MPPGQFPSSQHPQTAGSAPWARDNAWPSTPPWGPAPGWTAPPPRRRRGLLIALVTVGVLVLAGLGVSAFLLVRGLTDGGAPGLGADAQTVRTPVLTYDVPGDWDVDGGPLSTELGAEFVDVARAGAYDCDDNTYLRGVATNTTVVTGPAALPDVATGFARTLGSSYYTGRDGAPPAVQVSAPVTVDVDGVAATLVEATVRTATDDGCLATGGTLLVLVVPAGVLEGLGVAAVLVANADTSGGPSGEPSPERRTLDAIIDSARLTGI